ncbi:hypothetical protein [Klebsiella phage phiKp_21]|nr:hypothetical protein [Klebsiella phage phiKp_21]
MKFIKNILLFCIFSTCITNYVYATQMNCVNVQDNKFCTSTDENGNTVRTNIYRFDNIETIESSGTDSNGNTFVNKCTVIKMDNYSTINCN